MLKKRKTKAIAGCWRWFALGCLTLFWIFSGRLDSAHAARAGHTASLQAAVTRASATAIDVNPTDDPALVTAVSWNVELNDAAPAVIAEQLAAFDDVDLWGIVEVNQPRLTATLEQAAEVGEGADYGSVLSASGGGDRLLALYDKTRFDLIDSWEIDAINTTGNARAPLVLQLRARHSDVEFLFMVNHLYRSREEERHRQARLLNAWAAEQTLPVLAVGDYNFDWSVAGGETDHDPGYDLLVANGEWLWLQPATLVTTQCSGWPCRYESILDFVFLAGAAQTWRGESEIIVRPNDFPDDELTSDHRPVLARVWPEAAPAASPTPTRINVLLPIVNRNANLRAGPGTNYAIMGAAQQGDTLEVAAATADGGWLQLADGRWIAAFLVENVPADLASAAPPPVLAAPAVTEPVPTPPAATEPTTRVGPVVQDVQPPAAPADVVIESVYFDGQVSYVESDEYIVILNRGGGPLSLAGWRINADDPGQDFWFPEVELAAGARVRVYTNERHSEWGGFSFGSGKAIWNNKGDCGHLFDSSGTEVSTYCY